MFRFGKDTDPQKDFIVNKGNVVMVSEGDYKVAYDRALSGHVSIATSPDSIKINVDRDVKDASIYLNSSGKPCQVSVGSGILAVDVPGKNSSYKVASGTLEATLDKGRIGVVKAKVSTGILSNSTDLAESVSHEHLPFGHNPFGAAGMSSTVELVGEVQGSTTTFEVGAGTLNFHE